MPDLKAAAQFLDQHLLRWIDRFADQLKKAEATPYFVTLAGLTVAYIDEIREHLERLTGLARATSVPAASKNDKAAASKYKEMSPFHPGRGPGW